MKYSACAAGTGYSFTVECFALSQLQLYLVPGKEVFFNVSSKGRWRNPYNTMEKKRKCITQTGERKQNTQYYINILKALIEVHILPFCFGPYNLLLKELDVW